MLSPIKTARRQRLSTMLLSAEERAIRWALVGCVSMGPGFGQRRLLIRLYRALHWVLSLQDSAKAKEERIAIQGSASKVLHQRGGVFLWLLGLGVVMLTRSPRMTLAISAGALVSLVVLLAYAVALMVLKTTGAII